MQETISYAISHDEPVESALSMAVSVGPSREKESPLVDSRAMLGKDGFDN
jgi:hypothetical protein